jgi:Transcriptional regulator PadR-like family
MAAITQERLGVEHALLGLLRERPMHAYEMNQRLSAVDALRLIWRLKQSHLYALLAKLEAEVLVASSTETHGPDRHGVSCGSRPLERTPSRAGSPRRCATGATSGWSSWPSSSLPRKWAATLCVNS